MSMREKLGNKLVAIEEMQEQVAENRLKKYQGSKLEWREIIENTNDTIDAVVTTFEILNSVFVKQDIKKSIEKLEEALDEVNKERLDLSHIMENENLSAQKGYEVYREYREASRLRRLVKESVSFLQDIQSSEVESLLRKLGHLNNKLSKAESQVKYTTRVRSDLLPFEKVCPSYSERVELYTVNTDDD